RGAHRPQRGGRGLAARHVLHSRADDQSWPPAREGALRWLDGGDARPLAVGAIRAFGGRHRNRCRDLHALAERPEQAALSPLRREMGEKREGLEEAPHYHGHRERLRKRLREGGVGALADYELLELVLFRALPRRDVKPLAKALIAKFGSFAEVISAPPARL